MEETLEEKVARLTAEIESLKSENLKLTEELSVLKEKFFASRREKNSPNAGQKINKKKFPHNQNPNAEINLAKDVELVETIVEHKLDEFKCKHCDSGDLVEMTNAFEESNELDVLKQKYINRRHKRQKYKCQCCKKITTAPGGVKLTKGAEFSIAIATQVACDKFEDHIPLDRQHKQFLRSGLKVDVKTLFGLTEHLANRLGSVIEKIKSDLKENKWIHIDESPMTFYKKTKMNGYIWSISNPYGVYYQFEESRGGVVAREMLRGYKGVVVSDALSSYDWIESEEGLTHAHCWAHVRRRFFDAIKTYPVASEFVDLIDKLYDVEREATKLSELKVLRNEKSAKIVHDIDQKLESLDGGYLQESLIGKAINYYLSCKEKLHRFLTNELIPIDNNMAERSQRAPVMGRKNYLHFKSINGADVGMTFYTIIESCKLNGLDPRFYIEEMAIRSARDEEVETPYSYARSKIIEDEKLLALKRSPD